MPIKKQIKKSHKSSGVTIVGVLIGTTILSIALVSQIRLLGSTIKREADLRNIITATNLAREGVEIAFAWRISDGWEALKSLKDSNTLFCADIGLQRASGDCTTKKLNFVLKQNSRNFLYADTDTNLKYTVPSYWRTIELKPCEDTFTDGECLKIIASSGWGEYSETNKKISLEKKIYNWYVP